MSPLQRLLASQPKRCFRPPFMVRLSPPVMTGVNHQAQAASSCGYTWHRQISCNSTSTCHIGKQLHLGTSSTKIKISRWITTSHPSLQQQSDSSTLLALSERNRQVILENLTHEDIETGNSNVRIAQITLNRPKANAMGRVFLDELQECISLLEKLDYDQSSSNAPRCVVLTSNVKGVFSAGADLKERAEMTMEQAVEFVTELRNTFHRISLLPIPTIAALDGVALGGGLELSLCCDLRVASSSPQTRIGLPETTLAIIPGAGGTQRLSRSIGVARAKQWIWTGRVVTAEQAYEELGNGGELLQELVPAGNSTADGKSPDASSSTQIEAAADAPLFPARDRALEIAWQIATKSGPIAIRASKQAIEQGLWATSSMEQALEIERECYAKVIPTKDRLEGLAAFKEKRRPHYTGE